MKFSEECIEGRVVRILRSGAEVSNEWNKDWSMNGSDNSSIRC